MYIQHSNHKMEERFTHVHENEYEIMYCVRGGYQFHYQRPGEEMVEGITVRPQTMLFIPKGLSHGNSAIRYPYERYYLLFPARDLERIDGAQTALCALSGLGGAPCVWDVRAAAQQVEEIMERMYNVQFSVDMDAVWKQMNLNSLLGLLFCAVYGRYKNYFIPTLSHYTQPVQRAKDYMDAHYDQPMTVEEMAKACFLSPNYLSKSFHSQVGMSPRQYLTRKRLTSAQKLLGSTQLSVQEIAMRVGFGDVNYFIHLFKETYGLTPRRYQKSVALEEMTSG